VRGSFQSGYFPLYSPSVNNGEKHQFISPMLDVQEEMNYYDEITGQKLDFD